MTRRAFILRTQILQCHVISKKYELLMCKIMSPMFDCLDDSIKLDVISTITSSSPRHLLAIIGYRATLLS